MMSIRSETLEKIISSRLLRYPCIVYYNKKYPKGWMFEAKDVPVQRIGYTYEQALEFSLHSDVLNIVKDELIKRYMYCL